MRNTTGFWLLSSRAQNIDRRDTIADRAMGKVHHSILILLGPKSTAISTTTYQSHDSSWKLQRQPSAATALLSRSHCILASVT